MMASYLIINFINESGDCSIELNRQCNKYWDRIANQLEHVMLDQNRPEITASLSADSRSS